VKCTRCARPVRDGTSICPYCDAILDESILGILPPDHDEDTPLPEPVPPAAAGPKERPKVRRAPVEDLPPRSADKPHPPYSEEPSRYGEEDGQHHWTADGASQAAGPRNPSREPDASTAKTEPASSSTEQFFRMLGRGWSAFRGLQFEEKLTAAAAAGLSLMSLMPWKTTLAEGEETGLLSGGFWTLLLGALAGASIWARGAKRERLLPRDRWPLVAIGAGALSAIIGAITVATSFERTMHAGRLFSIAWPSFGAYGALLSAAGLVLGGTLTLMRERQSAARER
jgi:hypothetical protein